MTYTEVSSVLKMWFKSHLKIKFHLITEQAKTEIIKDICIIADNAIKDWKSSQTLIGVRKNYWKFDILSLSFYE